MKREEILINATSTEVRAALVDSGVLQEVQIERTSRVGLVSNIYKGKVSRVLPGMQAAFVELGLERTAFLHASDIARNPHAEPKADEVEPDIREVVREGLELLVQVLKEPLGTKGARLTTYIAIPSRYLVLTPNSVGVGVSSRIDDEAEAAAMLEALSGRPHQVLTAVAVRCGARTDTRVATSEVRFRATTAEERAAYCATDEPYDKAGGYGIQGRAAVFVEHLTGSYTNVVGLPLFETAALLERCGVSLWSELQVA